ncbi:hypothetical protein PFISCL1PPCAC_28256, partial [Pristionchus fissidentatus]
STKTLGVYFGFFLCCLGCLVDYGNERWNTYLHWLFKIVVLFSMELLIYTPLREFRPWEIVEHISFDYVKRYYRGLTLAASAIRY